MDFYYVCTFDGISFHTASALYMYVNVCQLSHSMSSSLEHNISDVYNGVHLACYTCTF